MAEEPVYSPDQLKPGNRKWARRGALGTAVLLILSAIWGHRGGYTEVIYLVVLALGLIGIVIADSVMRRNGLKPNDQ